MFYRVWCGVARRGDERGKTFRRFFFILTISALFNRMPIIFLTFSAEAPLNTKLLSIIREEKTLCIAEHQKCV